MLTTPCPNPQIPPAEWEYALGVIDVLAGKHCVFPSAPLGIDDLRQVARIAVWRAATRFDPQRRTRFRTVAWEYALNGIRHAKRDWSHIASWRQEAIRKGAEPHPYELPVLSLHGFAEDEDLAPTHEFDTESLLRAEHIHWAISQLSPADQELVRLRFMEGVSCVTLARRRRITPRALSREFSRIYGVLRPLLTAAGLGGRGA
jgi:RNA polymerase sigma factor (sigma-70 family)